MKTKFFALPFFLLLLFTKSQAQYCTPSVNKGGVYFTAVYFSYPDYASGIDNGAGHFSLSEGYTDNSLHSAGTGIRNGKVSIPFNINNPSDKAVAINVRVYADWNGDNDFDDEGELIYDLDYTLDSKTTFGSSASWTNLAGVSPSVHIRFAVCEGGAKANPCGDYTGEIEDYTLVLTGADIVKKK